MIETVIVIPIFVLVLGGLMAFGQWYLIQHRVVALSQYGMGMRRAGYDPLRVRDGLRAECRGQIWESLEVKVEGIPLAAFFPSTSQRVSCELDFSKYLTPWQRGWVRPVQDRLVMTVDSWHYGIPHE